MTPQAFVDKWRDMALKERSASQSHFNDLCRLLGKPSPTDADKTGEWYTFERGADKSTGRAGWADVWKRDAFAWEYKGPKKDLRAAYSQLQQYRESLENPPLLIVSDMSVIEVHTNFTSMVPVVYLFALDDLLDPRKLGLLGRIFDEPTAFRVERTRDDVTKEAATDFARLADILRDQGVDAHRAAHYLIRLLFCLFAEDAELLPNNAFTKLVEVTKDTPEQFTFGLRQLFGAMAKGGLFGFERIKHFNGRLFDDEDAVPLSRNGLRVLSSVAKLDWSSIEPSIFGTLFERSLDPSKRAQLGAHYTPRSDIILVVEPVLMSPLRRKWATIKAESLAMSYTQADATAQQRAKVDAQLTQALLAFMRELATIRVLDPACGSGNFLYVALLLLLDLWKEVWVFMGELGLQRPLALEDVTPSPSQLHGIEINEFAAELAHVTIWIGYIQWYISNGFGVPREPILKSLDMIENRDAILAYDAEGRPVEPEWPGAEVIVGNPPFLGGKKLKAILGEPYLAQLYRVYGDRLHGESDLVCYWFERARREISQSTTKRAGLLATNSIRGGVNRGVLERIKTSGDIFAAWSDRPWVIDGAAVRVSLIGFDDGAERSRVLNGVGVGRINSDLTAAVDLTTSCRLTENAGLTFQGTSKVGSFDIDGVTAARMILASGNPNGRSNADVVKPWVNSKDIAGRNRGHWIIDFGADLTLEQAAGYEVPFEYVLLTVKPDRDRNNRESRKRRWWLFGETAPAMRRAIAPRTRYMVTPTVSKHRVFAWLGRDVVPDHQLIVIGRDDDYFFGVLHSRPHELWALRLGTSLEDRPRYTPTTTFETFPFPWSPGHEPTTDPRVIAIADAARELVEKRDRWLNPEGASEADLKKRTLTNLYNQRPTWLDLAHKKLDAAVFAAYGWPEGLTDEEVLERLLALNGERAKGAQS